MSTAGDFATAANILVRTPSTPSSDVVADTFFRLEARFEQLFIERARILNLQEALSKQHDELKVREEALIHERQDLATLEANLAIREEAAARKDSELRERQLHLEEQGALLNERDAASQMHVEHTIKLQSEAIARHDANQLRNRELDDRKTSLDEREAQAAVCHSELEQQEARLQAQQDALNSTAEDVGLREADVERREQSVQERESAMTIEEDRDPKAKQDAERKHASLDSTNLDEASDLEEDFVKNMGSPAFDDGRIQDSAVCGHFGEVLSCDFGRMTAVDAQNYVEVVHFDSNLEGWTGLINIPDDLASDKEKEAIQAHGFYDPSGEGETPQLQQVILRQFIPKKCTDEMYTRRILLQWHETEFEGECSFPRRAKQEEPKQNESQQEEQGEEEVMKQKAQDAKANEDDGYNEDGEDDSDSGSDEDSDSSEDGDET